MARLGDVASYMNGYAFKPSDWSDTGLPIIRIQDLTGNSYQANRYNGEYALKYEVNQGDVLISWSASLGVYVWQGEKALLNQHIFKVIFDKTEISKSFFVHQVENILEKASSEAHGATMKHLTKPVFDALPFYLPPLDEQRKIAAVLDKVSSLIAKRRQQLDKLDELVKARFVEMFGDLADPACKHIRCKLGETCKDSDDIKCGPFGTQLSKTEYQEQGVAVWEIPQINREFKEQPIHFVTNEKAKQLISYSLIPGDIAMSRKGNVGRCALFPKDFAPGIIHSDVLRIRVDKNKVNPCFLMYQLHFSKAVAHQIEMVSSGAVMAGINVTKLKQIYVHIPAFGLQNQFAAFVEQTEKTKTTISESLEKLETLKKALMQEYFG